MENINRRDLLKFVPVLISLSFASKIPFLKMAYAAPTPFKDVPHKTTHGSNFRAIYGDEELRAQFLGFLENVYSIYPNKEFHALILDATQKYETDEEIYKEVQRQLPEITPFMALVRYSLPSLKHQKKEMSRQAGILLGETKKVNNYVEIGSPGTYVAGIKDHVEVDGKVYLLHVENPHYSPEDIVQRGRLRKVGTFVDMGDYKNVPASEIPPGKIDLVSNYIGFHHAKSGQRMSFIKSVTDLLPSGGQLIVRDHDVKDQTMAHIVALAHDVFNSGLNVEWKVNEEEIRNFTTVARIEEELSFLGLTRKGDYLLQEGDPTINTLMIFEKA